MSSPFHHYFMWGNNFDMILKQSISVFHLIQSTLQISNSVARKYHFQQATMIQTNSIPQSDHKDTICSRPLEKLLSYRRNVLLSLFHDLFFHLFFLLDYFTFPWFRTPVATSVAFSHLNSKAKKHGEMLYRYWYIIYL